MNENEGILQTTKEYVIRLEAGIENLVKEIRSDNKYQAETIFEIVEGVYWCLNVFKLTSEFNDENEIAEILSAIGELVIAVESTDDVLIADLLQYEFLPKVSSWNKNLNKEKCLI